MPWAACPPLFSGLQQGLTSRPWHPIDFIIRLIETAEDLTEKAVVREPIRNSAFCFLEFGADIESDAGCGLKTAAISGRGECLRGDSRRIIGFFGGVPAIVAVPTNLSLLIDTPTLPMLWVVCRLVVLGGNGVG